MDTYEYFESSVQKTTSEITRDTNGSVTGGQKKKKKTLRKNRKIQYKVEPTLAMNSPPSHHQSESEACWSLKSEQMSLLDSIFLGEGALGGQPAGEGRKNRLSCYRKV